MRRTTVIAILLGLVLLGLTSAGPAAGAGTWAWPVRGPIVRPYDPPASPYGSGHRGIDVAVPAGSVVVAPAPGVVSFAGHVAGQLYVSIDHGAGLVSTGSYLSGALVAKDDPVVAGQPIGLTGTGHPGATIAHLHFGVRLGGVYVDPLDYLGPLSLADIVWLAPIDGPPDPPALGSPMDRVTGGSPGVELVPSPGTAAGLQAGVPAVPALEGPRPSPLRGRPVPA